MKHDSQPHGLVWAGSAGAGLIAVALGALLLMACAERAPAEGTLGTMEQRDSAGVLLYLNPAPQWGEGDAWTVGLPSLDLAQTGTGPDHTFFGVTDATRFADGTIAVAMRHEIRWYSADGRFVARRGGGGEGPGEYEGGISLGRRGDTLVAYDAELRRFTEYGEDFEMKSVVQLHEGAFEPMFVPLGSGFLVHAATTAYEGDHEGLIRQGTPVVLYDRSGEAPDTMWELAGWELVRLTRGDGYLIEAPPFGRRGHLASSGGRVLAGDATYLGFEQLPFGGVRHAIVRAGKDLRVSRVRLDSERDALLGPDPTPELQRLWDDLIHAMPQPMTVPAYSAMEVGPDGVVWLEVFAGAAEADAARPWEVFSEGNQWLGQVVLPAGFQALEFGSGFVLGVRRDSLGVEAVQVLPIAKGR